MRLSLSPSDLSSFAHTRFHARSKAITGNFPDFLIVGPQRTGTTWLTENLRLHPELFLSSPKELFFFSRLQSPNSHQSWYRESFAWRLCLSNPRAFARQVEKIAYFDLGLKTGRYRANELEWYLSFFELNGRTTRKHRRLMRELYQEPFRPRALGEATASYAALEPEIIREVLMLNPGIKVVLMVRDPVSRAWSHAKKDLVRDALAAREQVTDEAFFRFFDDTYQERCGAYTEQIRSWSDHLQEGHLYIGEYSRIAREPKSLLLELLDFLGVSTDERYLSGKMKERINETSDARIPAVHKAYLDDKFHAQKQQLAERYGIRFDA